MKAIVIMRESGLVDYEDSERVLNGILDYITDHDVSEDDIVEAVHEYIEKQSDNQAEISTKDFFDKLRKEQSG